MDQDSREDTENKPKNLVRKPFLRKRNLVKVNPLQEAEEAFNYYWGLYNEKTSPNLDQYTWTERATLSYLSKENLIEAKITKPNNIGPGTSVRSLKRLVNRQDPVGHAATYELNKRQAAEPMSQDQAAKHFLDAIVPHYIHHDPEVLKKIASSGIEGPLGDKLKTGISNALQKKKAFDASNWRSLRHTVPSYKGMEGAFKRKASDEKAKKTEDAISAVSKSYGNASPEHRALVDSLYLEKRPELERQMKSLSYAKDSPQRQAKIDAFLKDNQHFIHHIARESSTSMLAIDPSDTETQKKIMKDHPHLTKPYQVKDFLKFVKNSPVHAAAYKSMPKSFPRPVAKEEPEAQPAKEKSTLQKVKSSLGLKFASNARGKVSSLFRKVLKK